MLHIWSSYLHCTTHHQAAGESTTWKEKHDERQQEKHGPNLNRPRWFSRGDDMPEMSEFLQRFVQLISSYHQQRASQCNQNIRTYIVSIKQPSLPNPPPTSKSWEFFQPCAFVLGLHLCSSQAATEQDQTFHLLALDGPIYHLAATQDPSCKGSNSLGPARGDSPSMPWCYSA